jgi:hypothetical protein
MFESDLERGFRRKGHNSFLGKSTWGLLINRWIARIHWSISLRYRFILHFSNVRGSLVFSYRSDHTSFDFWHTFRVVISWTLAIFSPCCFEPAQIHFLAFSLRISHAWQHCSFLNTLPVCFFVDTFYLIPHVFANLCVHHSEQMIFPRLLKCFTSFVLLIALLWSLGFESGSKLIRIEEYTRPFRWSLKSFFVLFLLETIPGLALSRTGILMITVEIGNSHFHVSGSFLPHGNGTGLIHKISSV